MSRAVLRWSLHRLLPAEEADRVLDELGELYEIRRRARGRLRAALWYRRQTLAFPLRLLVARLRGGLDHRPHPAPRPRLAPRRDRRGSPMETILQDLRYAVRTLGATPSVLAVVVLALAIGIGASAAIFSVVDALLVRPLPYAEPEEVVMLWETDTDDSGDVTLGSVSMVNLDDWHAQSTAFEAVSASWGWSPTLTGEGVAEYLRGENVSAEMFATVLPVEPVLGRVFTEEEDEVGAPRVVLLSHELWEGRFGGDPDIVGRDLVLGGEAHTVVGVLPPGTSTPTVPDAVLWRPINIDYRSFGRGAHYASALGRLRDGVSVEAAQAELDAVAARLEQEYPRTNTGSGVAVVPLREELVGDLRPALYTLVGAVAVLLLIACANAGNILLARTAARRGEFAVRAALGAGRRRLVRQVVTESLLLATVGGGLGVLLANWGLQGLLALAPPGLPRLDAVAVDGRVLGFGLAMTVLTGVIFGSVPALRASRPDPAAAMESREGGGSTDGGGRRLQRTLIIAQVAMAMLLLVGSGLLIRSFAALVGEELGFEPRSLLAARINPAGYDEPEQMTALVDRVLAEIERHPDAVSVATFNFPPFSNYAAITDITLLDRPEPGPGDRPTARIVAVSPDFHRAMGMPLLRGRGIQASDRQEAPWVAVVNETAARRYFADADPVGRPIEVGVSWMLEERPRTVVGVVGDVRYRALGREPDPQVFLPYPQHPSESMSFLVRTRGDPGDFVAEMRAAVRAVDPGIALYDVATYDERLGGAVAAERFTTTLLTVFAIVALTLAAIGLYGMLAYSVSRRTRELGIRMALGARARQVTGMVVGDGLRLVGTGLAIGLAGALAAGRLARSLLYEVEPTDPLTYAGVTLLLVAVAAVAAWLPARRASRIDPMETLRTG